MKSLRESIAHVGDYISERLKFPFYSRQEADLQNSPETTETAKPEQVESTYVQYDPFASYSSSQFSQQTIWSANKNDMIKKWREASYLPEVDAAVTEIANEAIVYDEIEDPIKLNLSDVDLPDEIKEKMEDSFDNILYLLDFNERGDELFKQWYIDGQLNLEVVFDNARLREGIQKLVLLSPFNFNQFMDVTTKQKKYYYGDITATNVQLKLKNNENVFYDEQITSINSGLWSMDRKFPISYLNKAMKAINQLTLIEDSLVIYRITRSPEKRAFYIATGNLPKAKAEEYMRSLISKYRQKRIYNTDQGTIENKNRSISILEDFWFPVGKDGQGTRVESIAGQSPNFTSFEDVDYFVNKVYRSLGIPVNRRAPDSRLTIGNNIDIEKDELKFFKFILKLRRKFNNLFTDLLKKDLIAKSVMSLEDWNIIQEKIKYAYANSNEYSEIKNNQIISMRVDSANSAAGLLESKMISKKYIQKNILRLTDEEIKEIAEDNALEAGTKKPEEEFGGSDFGEDYDIRPREFEPTPGSETPEETPAPETPSEKAAPAGAAAPAANPTKPIGAGGAAEGIKLTVGGKTMLAERVFNKRILKNLKEGDVISNGTVHLKVINGKLEIIE
jgi:hypothetical protein